jgi:hypothetical protein
MSDTLDKVFPPDQCINENTLALLENQIGETATFFFMVYGPDAYHPLSAQVHIQSPFTFSYQDRSEQNVVYSALEEFPEALALLRKKVTQDTPTE